VQGPRWAACFCRAKVGQRPRAVGGWPALHEPRAIGLLVGSGAATMCGQISALNAALGGASSFLDEG